MRRHLEGAGQVASKAVFAPPVHHQCLADVHTLPVFTIPLPPPGALGAALQAKHPGAFAFQ